MAFIQQPGADVENYYVFNVSHAVGANAANWWTDIMFVQYFVCYIYSLGNAGNGWNVELSTDELIDLPDPNVDFKNLKKTTRWIQRFQSDVVKQGGKLHIDGRVDRSRGLLTPRTQSFFTIIDLNLNFSGIVGESKQVEDPLAFALGDVFMPNLLKGELITSDINSR